MSSRTEIVVDKYSKVLNDGDRTNVLPRLIIPKLGEIDYVLDTDTFFRRIWFIREFPKSGECNLTSILWAVMLS